MARERFVWDEVAGALVPVGEYYARQAAAVQRSHLPTPMLQRDLPAYRSPLGTGVIEGRAARREDLKRGGCREVDPTEWRAEYHNPRFAAQHGLPYTPPPASVASGDDDAAPAPFVRQAAPEGRPVAVELPTVV